jgi:hypothetical protein
MRAGLRGLWDTITGRARGIRRINEQETLRAIQRDREERDALVLNQLDERAPLQQRLSARRRTHVQERHLLTRELVQTMRRAMLNRNRAPEPPTRRRRNRNLSLDR